MSDDSSLEADQPSAEAGEVGPRPLDSGRRPAGERPSQPPRHWADADPVERVEAVTAADMPAFRARQLNAHYFGHWSDDPLTWTDLSASHRQQAERFFPQLLSLVRSQRADDGATLKNLYRLHDGSLIETVIMRYLRTDVANRPPWPTEVVASTTGRSTGTRTTLCISTQVGCGMGCAFCATGQLGLSRNLSVGEILEQVRLSGQALAAGQVAGGAGRVSHIVFMGMGEPLANYEATVRALHQLTAPAPTGFGLSARGITVSTVGLAPRIERLAAEGLPVTLAISLHAPDDDLRQRLVPVNQRYPVAEVLDAAWAYAATTKRRVSIEYALIRDINDQPSRAAQLAQQLKKRGNWGWFHVNLIPLNPVPDSIWTASRPAARKTFQQTLEAAGVPVTLRYTRGQTIDAACGQLAARPVPGQPG